MRSRCPLTDRTPRVVTAMSEPIAASETATTDSATSTSTSVKPAWPLASVSELIARNNFNSSRQPVDADLIAGAEPGQRDGAAARHAGGKEIDRGAGRPLIAARRQHRIERDIV